VLCEVSVHARGGAVGVAIGWPRGMSPVFLALVALASGAASERA
jgi:hypothetical protein